MTMEENSFPWGEGRKKCYKLKGKIDKQKLCFVSNCCYWIVLQLLFGSKWNLVYQILVYFDGKDYTLGTK